MTTSLVARFPLRDYFPLVGLLGAVLLARLALAAIVPLGEDEAYYWQWSRYLAPDYFDHPPMIAYLIALGTWLTDASTFGVRLPAVLLSVATLACTYGLGVVTTGNRKQSLYAVALFAVVPLFTVGNWLATPDAALLFFWSAALLSAALTLRDGRYWQWILTGLLIACAAFSKHTGVLLAVSLGIVLLMSARTRPALRTPAPYLATLVALIPPAAWILAYGMPGLKFQFAHGFGIGEQHFVPATVGEFVGGQAAVVTPFIFALLVFAVLRELGYFRSGNVSRTAWPIGEMRLLLLVPTIVVLGTFLFSSFFGDGEANWAAPAYITGFVLVGGEFVRLQQGSRRERLFASATLVIPVVASLLIFVQLLNPLISIPAAAKLRDRQPLADWAQSLREQTSLELPVLASNHKLASVLAFNLPQQPHTGAPFVRGSGSAYRAWSLPACDHDHAWYFSTKSRDRRLTKLFSEVTGFHRFDELYAGRKVNEVFAFRGVLKRDLCTRIGSHDSADRSKHPA